MSEDQIPLCVQRLFDEIKTNEIALDYIVQQRNEANRRIGIEMRIQRKLRQVSLRSLARKLEISAAFLSDMELGNRAYTPDWAMRSLRILGGEPYAST